ncbi:Tfp pilus assembly protein PilF [Cricetibacter osteomyelitidis]|uniref:Tfp pilus assembly protein PilF n=1 Tax=Cricetibacter osteomyelitidis TaxID=1521931 RepID=A0A4R2T401_9PAST|nr:tetratricopeptide repeat protein [Cricetibacter osteomyelitidis]TCP97699.1 Tfp pilus assembly protein PilF [Cricetibacter osteomyelitidis]
MNLETVRKKFFQAEQLANQGKFIEAVISLNEILQHHPNHAQILTFLANIQIHLNKLEPAQDNLQKALKTDPENADIYFQFGQLFKKMNNMHVALGYFHKSVKLHPNQHNRFLYLSTRQAVAESRLDFLAVKSLFDEFIVQYPKHYNAYYHRARVYGELREYDKAKQDLECCLALNPKNAHAWTRKAMLLLLLGEHEEGWKIYEQRLSMKTLSVKSPVEGLERWCGQDVGERKLLIYAEQGFGDNIQFLRYALEAKKRGFAIAVWNFTPLQSFLKANLARYGIDVMMNGEKLSKKAYYQVSMMSLPHYFGTTVDNIPNKAPYLQVEAEFDRKWKKQIPASKKLKIGIVWAGSKTNARDHQRSIALDELQSILDFDADFHCIQKDISKFDRVKAAKIKNLTLWDKELNDFSDTAGLIEQLDLIVTIDSSVAHLAGAMGKPTWVLINGFPDFRWLLNRDDCAWYDSVRVFRQDDDLNWQPTIEKVRSALEQL